MKHKELKYGLIGSIIEVESSKNKTLVGIKGKVIDETKNTFTLMTKNSRKKIIKSQVKVKTQG